MRSRFGRRMQARRAARFVRKIVVNSGPIEAKRFNFDNIAIPVISSVAYDNPLTIGLAVTQETMDEEVESDSSSVAQVPLYSKFVSMKGNIMVHSLTAGDRCRWILYKDVDNEGALSDLTDSFFHNSNDDPTNRELRARILAKGVIVASDKTAHRVPIFIKRKTLQRLGNMRENDRIELMLAVSGSNVARVTGFGTLYFRLN